jgi:uncharacterized protein YjbI with pentapeptide repeats
MTGASLRGANLCNANLGRDSVGGSTRLSGADLTNARIVGTVFEGVACDESTRYPDGFPAKENQ